MEKKKHSVSVGIFEESNTKLTGNSSISGEGNVDDSQNEQIVSIEDNMGYHDIIVSVGIFEESNTKQTGNSSISRV